MRYQKVVLAIALGLVLVWLAGSTAVQRSQAAQQPAVTEARARTTITSTVYLPFIARPAPTVPYVLTKIKLPPGSHPHGIALDLNGERAFVGNHQANTLSVIDTAAMTLVATITLPSVSGPNGVAYHAGLDRVYVANRDSNNLSIVDPTQRVWIANRAVGSSPDGVAVSGDLVYVANFGSNSVSILNAQTNLVTSTLAIGVEPALFAQLEDSGTVFLSSHGNGSVYFLQNGVYANSHSGITTPYGLSIDQITQRLYIANRGESHTVTLLDVDPNGIVDAINVGQEPYVLGVNSRTGHVFVSLGNRVNVYDRRDNALITSLPVGTGAEEGLAVDPARGLVYVTSRDTDEVTVIQDSPATDLVFVTYITHPSGLSHSNIFLADDTGQHVKQLTQASTESDLNWQPTFRPDGKVLAFTSSRDADHEWDVFTMDLFGQNQINLTDDGGTDNQQPAWSPDGTQIAWRRDWNIWVMNADGSNKRQLTSGLTARSPLWSPDGQWICFIAFPPGEMYQVDVYIIAASGGTPIDLINNPANEPQANWSPDSREIVFETDRHNVVSNTRVLTYNWELYKVDISTTLQTRLTDSPGQDHAAVWSPDGSQIAFVSDRGNRQYDYSLYVMDSDGTHQRRVTPALQLSFPLAWSPDGHRIAASTSWVLNGDIYMIDVATNQIRLLNQGTAPAWRPDTWK